MSDYIHLDDDRYEVRDIQYATGLLVDAGIVDPARIGVTGASYGGGVSLQLATLKDRVMGPDGTLSPWKSPAGTRLSIAAAAPMIPWSDLTYSLLRNGRTLDYRVTGPSDDLAPLGVSKQSFTAGLFALGAATGNYSTPLLDPQADLTTWYAAINAGEPYDLNPQDQAIATQIARYHSAYYLLDGAYGTAKEPPAPLLVGNGFTDDLFPVDEALRYYNLEQSLYPSNPIALFDGDFGHMRAQNKDDVRALLAARIEAFFGHYVAGTGAQPPLGATAMTETCPAGTPSGGPFTADTWAGLHLGEVDYDASGTHTVASSAGDATIGKTIDPIVGGGACATATAADQGAGVATYRLHAATGAGYTLLGAPTVIANLTVTGTFPMLAARLWDVDPKAGTETLVARGIYRIDSRKPDGLQVFQLHPGAWHFAAGHIPKLELLGQDSPYARTSNGVFQVELSGLQLRLPVHETPGTPASPPVVVKPSPPVTPHPHAAPMCVARPVSEIMHGSVRASRRGLAVSGTASEKPCAGANASARRREHVVHVWVMIYRPARHGNCRFLRATGKLARPRPCGRPIEYLAHGTTYWTLQLRIQIPPGQYLVRADAVDGFGRHQRDSAGSVIKVVVS